MKTKTCPRCGKEKPVSKFYKNKSKKDKLSCYCKDCEKEISKEYYEENKKEIKEKTQKWNRENPQKVKRYQKKWRKENKEKVKKLRKKWIEKNPEYWKKYSRKWRKENPEKAKKKKRKDNKKWRSDPKNRLNTNMGNLIRISLKEGKAGRHWENLVGYTVEDLKKHLEDQFEDWMNWDNWGRADEDKKTWQIDHIKPRSSFDFDSPEDKEFQKCWALENLQPLEAIKNIKKNND